MRERDGIRDLSAFEESKKEALASLDAMLASRSEEIPSNLAVVAEAAKLALEATAAGLGECREETPYAPLYPLIENGTFTWRCTHDPSHSAS